MKRFALVFALVLALCAGFGCAKKKSSEVVVHQCPQGDQEFDAAIRQINDGRVLFGFNKYSIRPEYKSTLATKADIMKKYGNLRVRIEGNCDERGTKDYNLALGERRARAAYDYLVNCGVNPAQLEMVSYGEENPAVEGHNEAAWRQNRRDDFRVVGQ